jgi:hypothetical protein
VSPADATTFQTFATISARISSAIVRAPSSSTCPCVDIQPRDPTTRPPSVPPRRATTIVGSSSSDPEVVVAKKSRKKKARKKNAANHGKRPNS